jgi:hypothetical protein
VSNKPSAPKRIEVKHESGSSLDDLSVQIREDELRRMAYEDDRRRRYLRSLRWASQQASPNVVEAAALRSASPPWNSLKRSAGDGRIHVSAGEVDASFKWLSEPRALILADRRSNAYTWFVTISKPRLDSEKPIYTLHWRELVTNNDEKSNAGFTIIGDLKDILECQYDSSMFTLVIGNSVKALKNSGGRPTINVKCTTVGECIKYRQTLQCIWLMLNQT